MSKSGVQKEMFESQWKKLLVERETRRRQSSVKLEPRPPAGLGPPIVEGSGKKRLRPGRGSFISSSDHLTATLSQHPLIVIDCDFDSLMNQGEMCSLTKQLVYSYAGVKKMDLNDGCARLLLTGLCASRVEALHKISGVHSWRAFATSLSLETVFLDACRRGKVGGGAEEESGAMFATSLDSVPESSAEGATAVASSIFEPASTAPCIGIGSPPPLQSFSTLPRDRLVYLTHDATNVLWEVQIGTAYIVGGLVDRNRHKGITAKKALSLGLPTARLPIEEALCCDDSQGGGPGNNLGNKNAMAFGKERKTRVLTTNKCVELLVMMCGSAKSEGGLPQTQSQLLAGWKRAVAEVLKDG